MQRFADAITTFEHAMERSRQMVTLFDALVALRPGASANDDALRSAYFQAVSSFDFFAHELALIEAVHRFGNSLRTRNIVLPMEIMVMQDAEVRKAEVANRIRSMNSYKAFVDPGKLAEMLSCYTEHPWRKLCAAMNQGRDPADLLTEEQVKGQLKSVWKRRNQIAHEADVNPTLAGISLWPIDRADTLLTINFILSLAVHLPPIISSPLPEVDQE